MPLTIPPQLAYREDLDGLPASYTLRAHDRWCDAFAGAEQFAPRADLETDWLWLAYLERLNRGRTVFVSIRDGQRLVAAAAITDPGDSTNMMDQTALMFGSSSTLRPGLPDHPELQDDLSAILTAGGRNGDDADALIDAYRDMLGPSLVLRHLWRSVPLISGPIGAGHETAIHSAIATWLIDLAAACGVQSVAYPFVPVGESSLREALDRAGFLSAAITAVGTIGGLDAFPTWDEFLTALPKKLRHRYRRDWKRFAEAGLELRRLNPGTYRDSWIDFEHQNRARYGADWSRDELGRMLDMLEESFGPALRRIGVFDGDRLIACGTDLISGASHVGICFGADYAVAEGRFTYQVLTFVEPVMLAIDQGLQQMELGPEAFEIKRSRGATFDGRLIYVRTVEPADPRADDFLSALCTVVDRRNRSFLSELEPQFGVAEAVI
jgi:hypothetical protein